ncbi:MAG: tRNA guanosine(15) transglycosylase TgtA, partial [Candidatus Thorarchaeota archaeon]
MGNFEIKTKDGLARIGKFATKHGTLTTPLLMPVIHPAKKAITPSSMVDDFGFQIVITNSYIISSNDKFREVALSEGVHGLLDFDGPIMTDSGTFQMYFHGLPEGEIDPIEIVEFQKSIGSDIGTILDVFSDPKVGREKVEADTKLSLERAKVSVGIKDKMMLAGTIQGGVFPDLREFSAESMGRLDFDVHPIGGVVPLMERYRYADIVDATMAAKKHLPLNRPVHLFGCGHPMFFAQAALLGCDFFDSASYAKFADAGRMLLTSGTVHLNELRELPCECPVCSTHDVDSLLAMSEDERSLQLMRHNLYVSAAEMRRVRQAIRDGKLFELAATRARSHPTLTQALKVMLKYIDQILPFEPVANTSSILYTGWETSMHPAIIRFHNRIVSRYPFRNTETMVLIPHLGDRPYSETTVKIVERIRQHTPSEVLLMFVTPFGIVPWEYEHVHPAQQCIYPKTLDIMTLKIVEERVSEFLGQSKSDNLVWLSRATPTDVIYSSFEGKIDSRSESADDIVDALKEPTSNTRWWERKIRSLISYQWNIDFPSFLENEDTSVTFSKATRKIRYVNRNNTIIFTLVPTSGLLTPTLEGGQELLQAGLSGQYTVTVDKDAAEFVAQGKSALAKFVEFAHPKLRAGEEVLLVNSSGDLLATGRTLLSGPEMMTFDRGVAVVTRHS